MYFHNVLSATSSRFSLASKTTPKVYCERQRAQIIICLRRRRKKICPESWLPSSSSSSNSNSKMREPTTASRFIEDRIQALQAGFIHWYAKGWWSCALALLLWVWNNRMWSYNFWGEHVMVLYVVSSPSSSSADGRMVDPARRPRPPPPLIILHHRLHSMHLLCELGVSWIRSYSIRKENSWWVFGSNVLLSKSMASCYLLNDPLYCTRPTFAVQKGEKRSILIIKCQAC